MSADVPDDLQAADSAKESKPQSPRSFGDVAKRIRSRTTDLLAIAVVLMGGLAVGGKVHLWWNAEEAESEDPVLAVENRQGKVTPWGVDDVPVSIAFGDAPQRISRVTFAGTRKEAGQRLEDTCRNVVDAAETPAVLQKDAEQRMLARLARFTPAVERGNIWRVYRFDGPVLMATATRRFPTIGDGPKTGQTPDRADAKSPYRVVCWGMAFPSGKERWTLFTFQPAGRGSGRSTNQQSAVTLPPETLRVFSLRDENGQTWITFRGAGPLSDWTRFYDELAHERDWRSETNWRHSGHRDSAVYFAGADNARRRISITVEGAPETGFTGTIIVTPLPKSR